MIWVASRYAGRSVRRNARRTVLAIVGIAVGCVLALLMESLNRGRGELFARVGATSGVGHLRIVPAGWPVRRDPGLRLADANAALAAARARRDVLRAAPRTRADVLLAVGTHVVPIEMVGVDPEIEPHLFRYVRRVEQGRYLNAGESNTLVLGRTIAERLSITVDDEVVATAVDPHGDIQSALFRVVGIVSTGSEDADATVCQVPQADVERLSGSAGTGEVSLVLADYRQADVVRAALAARIASGDRVMTMTELAPEIEGHFRQDAASARFVSLVILLIVVLGVASAQLAAVLERRREFAVLSALGMSAAGMVKLVVQEAVILGTAAGLLALTVGVPMVWRLARTGLDFRRYVGSAYAFQGVLFDPVILGDFGFWIVPYVFIVAMGATIVASLYPAWYAARTDPAVALRVAQ
ncbi:MAG TPA: FtsX-like permease family protein [Vicinamibacterales bacterium]|nr:FtsX-like permease family protein [Vicinamibacterales bacterium]